MEFVGGEAGAESVHTFDHNFLRTQGSSKNLLIVDETAEKEKI